MIKKVVVWILKIEAIIMLKRQKPLVVVIAGSVGKTSTKDLIAVAIGKYKTMRASEKSFNSEIGVPLTVLDLPNGWNNSVQWFFIICRGMCRALFQKKYPEVLVLEVGLEFPGDIRRVSKWLKIDVCVFTRLAEFPVHGEHFSSREALFEEKAKIFTSIKKDGVLVYNGDDDLLAPYVAAVKCKKISYGETEDSDICIEDSHIEYSSEGVPIGTICVVDKKEITLTGVLALHFGYVVAAAYAAARELGVSKKDIQKNIAEKYEPTPGRMHVLKGRNECVLIDDSYNSSPVALIEALHTLKKIKTNRDGTAGKKIAILGEMAQLGFAKIDAYKKVSDELEKCADVVIVVGENAKDLVAHIENHEGFVALQARDTDHAVQMVAQYLEKGDVVLCKGSQISRIERVVKSLLSRDLQPEKHLVRQSSEWSKR